MKFSFGNKEEIKEKIAKAIINKLYSEAVKYVQSSNEITSIADKINNAVGDKLGEQARIISESILSTIDSDKEKLTSGLMSKLETLKERPGMIWGNTNKINVNDSEELKKSKTLREFTQKKATYYRTKSKLQEFDIFYKGINIEFSDDKSEGKSDYEKLMADIEAEINKYNEIIQPDITNLTDETQLHEALKRIFDKYTEEDFNSYLKEINKDIKKFKKELDSIYKKEQKRKKSKNEDKLKQVKQGIKKAGEELIDSLTEDIYRDFESIWIDMEELYTYLTDIPKQIIQIPLSTIVSTPTGLGLSINKIPEALLNLKMLADSLGTKVSKVDIDLKKLGLNGKLSEGVPDSDSNLKGACLAADLFYTYVKKGIDIVTKTIQMAGGYVSIATTEIAEVEKYVPNLPDITIDNQIDADHCSNYVHDEENDGRTTYDEKENLIYVENLQKVKKSADNCTKYCILQELIPVEPKKPDPVDFERDPGMSDEIYNEVKRQLTEANQVAYETALRTYEKEMEEFNRKYVEGGKKCKNCKLFNKK